MKHYGDITKINGADVPIVDIICGGSPCQDLSVAGKRAGLDGERSGLFMEQIRIVKEQRNECIRQLSMRGADVDVRSIKPRYLVWENVPGAFSSNKGEDFRCVLEEICRIADKTANVPMPEKGKWSTSGCIVGDGWSVAWRVHDSQFWGVPQRRKRISVVADFGSESAGEILFERESLSGDIESSVKTGEEIAGTVGDGTPQASNVFGDNVMPTLVSRLETPVGNTQDGFNVISFQERAGCETEVNDTLNVYDQGETRTPTLIVKETEMEEMKTVVRRLTPTECERLQGYPDGWSNIGEWTDSKGKKHKDADSPRYKALGNSIALPFWQWMAERMVKQLKEDGVEHPTMASLFDGIGGFPLVYSRCGVEPIWASEIEEFPIAVTKIRFPEGEENGLE